MILKHRSSLLRVVFLRIAIVTCFRELKETSVIESVTHASIPIIYTCANFPENHRVSGKYEKILYQGTKHQPVNIQEKSYKCNEFGKMIHESSQCIPYDTHDTAENCSKCRYGKHKDASVESSSINRHKSGDSREEPCKFKNCLNMFPIINQNQRIHSCLSVHQRNHSGEKPHKCKACEPIKRIHTGEKPYKCSKCEKCFIQKAQLTIHQRIHTGEKPYKCSQCEKSFTCCSGLRKHQRVHTGEKPYKCSECKKSFTSGSDLRRHQKIHTGEKPYKCSECDKCFIQKVQLRIHHRIHTGDEPYKCGKCVKVFTHLSGLRKHQNIHSTEGKFPLVMNVARALSKFCP
uniref:zinc finger protein 525-like n=1 Tax=Arvicanthis niloticus TaxID=61156 RepID=UPI001486702F|nr:zinc finger protein 525-like [Arvicanthis niloticus]